MFDTTIRTHRFQWQFSGLLAATMMVLLICGAGSARAQLEPGVGRGWLTIASRSDANDAIAMARRYAGQFPTAAVMQSINGYYGVTLGWMDIAAGQPLLGQLKASGRIPSDSYFTAGQRFVQVIWTASGIRPANARALYAATRIDGGSRHVDVGPVPPKVTPPATQPAVIKVQPIDPRPGIVANLSSSDGYLSLRAGPGTSNREIARMLAGTTFTVTGTSDGWYEVRLDNGMTGWASSRYVQFAEIPVVGPTQPVDTGRNSGQEQADVPVVGPSRTESESQQQAKLPESSGGTATETGNRREPAAPKTDQKRVALVMGNSRYQHTTELANPKNDADAMSAKLTDLGFEVITALDGDKTAMERAVRDFVKVLPNSQVSLFFYAGHAMQVNGRNYLIPIDAKLEDETAIDFETIDLQVILDFMNAKERIAIALLDACRDNPLSRRFARNFTAARSAFIGRGLAAPETRGGEMLIGFATAPGQVALDGEGRNSPFTTALLRHIGAENVDIEVMLKQVKNDVYEMTRAEQEPWHNSALRRVFMFNPVQ